MRSALVIVIALVATACGRAGGGDEVKLSKRSRDAGPAVVIIDRVPHGASGSAVDEKEPNDGATAAELQPLSLPGAVRGRIDRAGDVDVYTVAIERTGTLAVRLSAVDDADLILEVRNEAGEVLAASDNGPAKIAEGIPNLYVQPGTVRLAVREFVKPVKQPRPPKPSSTKRGQPPTSAPAPVGGRTQPSQPYLLEVELLPPPEPGDEHEPNDQAAFADELTLGVPGRGFVGGKKDLDYWKVATDGMKDDEALAVDVDGVPDVALRVSVLDATGATLAARKGRTGDGVALRSLAVKDKTGTVFVVIGGDRGNTETTYSVRVTSAPLAVDEENEPNDTIAQANPLSDTPAATSGTRIGALGAGDVDVYKLDPAAGARVLSLVVEPPGTVDVELAVLDAGGAVIGGPADEGKKGALERLDGIPVAAGAAAYVRLKTISGSSDDRYQLRWTVGSAAESTSDDPE